MIDATAGPGHPPAAWDLIVFDLDGTLVDTRDGIATTLRSTLAGAGFAPPPAPAIYPLIGLPLAAVFRRFIPAAAPDEVVEQLIGQYRVTYREEVIPVTRPFPGVPATLEALDAAGQRLALATSKSVPVARATLAAAGLSGFFALVLGVESVARPKPAPDMVLEAAAALGADPARTLVVGDTTHDVAMGRAAGARVCAVTYGVQARDELLAAGPDYLVERTEDLLAIVWPSPRLERPSPAERERGRG